MNPTLLLSFCNLPNNAEVELREGRGQGLAAATICLQLESGERLTDSFEPGTTLWEILCHWENEVGSAKLRGAQTGEPVCVYMRLEIAGEQNLRETSLQKLGLIGGKTVIRLLFRPSEVMGEQAHVSRNYAIPFKDAKQPVPATERPVPTTPPVRPHDPVADGSAAAVAAAGRQHCRGAPASHPVVSTSTEKKSGVQDALERREDTARSAAEPSPEERPEAGRPVIGEEDVKYIGERKAVLFDLEHSFPFTIEEPGEEFFEVTLEDAKYLAADYQRQRKELEERPLETDHLRRLREMRKARQYSSALVRVYFPDRLVLQGTFLPEEKVADVADFVRGFLRCGSQDFYLYTSPPKTVLDPGLSLIEANLVPASVVHFGGGAPATGPLLRTEVLAMISTPGGASVAATRLWSKRSLLDDGPTREELCRLRPSSATTCKDAPEPPRERSPTRSPEMQKRPPSSAAGGGKVPKWFAKGK